MLQRLASVLLLSAVLAHAGTYWEYDWGTDRGVVVAGGTSLGAFTWAPYEVNFQGVVTLVASQPFELFPASLLDPTAPQTATYAPGDPATDGFSASLYQPYVPDPINNPAVVAWGYYTYIPGTLTLSTTPVTGGVKFGGNYRVQDPLGGVGNYTLSGVVGIGTGNTSALLRDGTLLVTQKATGYFFPTPEPATLWPSVGAVALFAWMLRRRAGALRRRA